MMPEKVSSALNTLREAASENDEKSVGKIDGALVDIVDEGDAASIEPMLLTLDDNFEFQEGMWSIMHSAESFPDSDYVKGLVKALPLLEKSAPTWAETLVLRIFNSEEYSHKFVIELVKSSVEAKNAFLKISKRVDAEYPFKFAARIEQIKTEAFLV